MKINPLEIVVAPADILSKKAESVQYPDLPEIKDLAIKMVHTMRVSQGIGLAAPQVGVSKRIVVVDTEKEPLILINPQIKGFRGFIISMEGCLSLPGQSKRILRKNSIFFLYRDSDWNLVEREVSGLTAICVQHEIDHLDGVLMTDHKEPEVLLGIKP